MEKDAQTPVAAKTRIFSFPILVFYPIGGPSPSVPTNQPTRFPTVHTPVDALLIFPRTRLWRGERKTELVVKGKWREEISA